VEKVGSQSQCITSHQRCCRCLHLRVSSIMGCLPSVARRSRSLHGESLQSLPIDFVERTARLLAAGMKAEGTA